MRGRSGGGCPEVNLALRRGTDALQSEPTSLHVSLSPAGLSQTSQRSRPREGPLLPGPPAGTAASVPARAAPGHRPRVRSREELKRLRGLLKGRGRVPRASKGRPPGAILLLGQRARPEPGRPSTSGLTRPFPGTGRCTSRPAGAQPRAGGGRQAGGSRTRHREAPAFSKDAAAGRLFSQDPEDLLDTVLSSSGRCPPLGGGWGTVTSGRGEGTAAERRVTWKRAEQDGVSAHDSKPDIRESSENLGG